MYVFLLFLCFFLTILTYFCFAQTYNPEVPVSLEHPFIATFCTALTSDSPDWKTEAGAAIDKLKVNFSLENWFTLKVQ